MEDKNKSLKNVLNFFYEISSIPRKSGNEEKIADYVENFAKKRELKYIRDINNNVIVFKEANNKSNEPIILQCHMDMVCEKRKNSNHNFDEDGLNIYIDGNNYLRAKDTTLGADNGIGMAMMLAILDDNNIKHPKIEAIFTVQEETTMAGAKLIDLSSIKGKRMISTDNMSENELWLGCASAKIFEYKIVKEECEIDDNYTLIKISLNNFIGGHSGRDIEKNRKNPIKLLGEILNDLNKKYDDIYINNIIGGDKVNVIPINSECMLYVRNDHLSDIIYCIKNVEEELHRNQDSNNEQIDIEIIEKHENKSLSKKITINIIEILNLIPHGVFYSDKYGNPLVSSNLGTVATGKKEIMIAFSIRSNRESICNELIMKIEKDINKYNIQENRYELPGYEHTKESEFVEMCKKIYVESFNRKPKLIDVHVGLEVGFFSEKIEDLDFVAISADIYDAHSPQERCSVESVERMYKYILDILKDS